MYSIEPHYYKYKYSSEPKISISNLFSVDLLGQVGRGGGGEAPQATQSAQDEIHAVRVSWGVGGAVKSIFEEIPVSKL